MKDGQGAPWPLGDQHDPASIVQALEQSRQRLLDFFEGGDAARMGQTFTLNPRELPDPADGPLEAYTGRNRVLYLTDHEVHHRGKVVLALRQWGMRAVPFMPC
jgi:uncharacterized damage-inducible protein DinB